jgi:16S rRNA (cytosine967-C5)-methyltransferase
LLRSSAIDALSPQDRNLCTALTMGVLRWQLLLDERIAPLLTHKTKLDDPVRVALRLAAFQLMFLDRIPAHAAISDSVELTKRTGHRFASGLVNAVLRKLATVATQSADPMRAHPAWLMQRWAVFFGDDCAAAICAYDQQPPPASVRLATPDAEASLVAEGIELEAGPFLTDSRRVLSGDVANAHAVRNGLARIQDEGSQLVAELFGASGRQNPSILDCCAAPGGKTAILAERHPHSRLVACDVSCARMERMQAFFKLQSRLSRIECRVADTTQLSAAEQFDLVLCDVPCSGTGTLARNPEIKLRLQPTDLLRQQERQIAILRSSLQAVAPGGELLYSTCSLEPEENEQVIQAVLEGEPRFQIAPVQQRLEQLRSNGTLHAEGATLLLSKGIRGDFLRTTPGILPVDGFFAAILTRK